MKRHSKEIIRHAQKKEQRIKARRQARQKQQRQKAEAKQDVVGQLHKTIQHFFPNLYEWMREIEDFRRKSSYELAEVITASIAMFIFKSGSRNALNNQRQEKHFKKNYVKLFKLDLPHPDTVDRVMRRLPPECLEKLKHKMVQTLLNKKAFHKYRFQNRCFVVAIDGSGVMSFSEQHCEHCLHKTLQKGKTTYFHNVLEAKLITPNGFAISLATEWIENPSGEYDKQDCERKAFA